MLKPVAHSLPDPELGLWHLIRSRLGADALDWYWSEIRGSLGHDLRVVLREKLERYGKYRVWKDIANRKSAECELVPLFEQIKEDVSI